MRTKARTLSLNMYVVKQRYKVIYFYIKYKFILNRLYVLIYPILILIISKSQIQKIPGLNRGCFIGCRFIEDVVNVLH